MCFLLAFGAPDLRVNAAGLDAAAVEAGLRARVASERLDDWSIEVESTDLRGQYDVRLTPPAGKAESRSIVLEATDEEGRSRELAAALSVIVDAWQAPEPEPESEPEPEPEPAPPSESESPGASPPRTRGQVLAAARMGVGDPADLDLGVGVSGAVELLRGHIQPRLDVAWSRSSDADLTLDGVRFGGGLAAGAAVHDMVWLGAALTPRALWVRAAERGEDTTWSFNLEAAGVLQFRAGRFLAELRSGVDVDGTPVRARGRSGELRWGYVRWVGVLGVGVRI